MMSSNSMKRFKKWHVASAVAIIAVIALIVVLVSRRTGSRLTSCSAPPMGDPGTSYTQDSNCAITCSTTDSNAMTMVDMSGACRSKCNPGFVKSTTTQMCTVSIQMAQATIDNMKVQLMDITDPTMKQQMNAQITAMQREVDTARVSVAPPGTVVQQQAAPQISAVPPPQTSSQPMSR